MAILEFKMAKLFNKINSLGDKMTRAQEIQRAQDGLASIIKLIEERKGKITPGIQNALISEASRYYADLDHPRPIRKAQTMVENKVISCQLENR